MQTLISFILVAIFQVVLPCPWWVFPEDTPIHCCEEKLLGGHRYMYQGYDESAKSEFNCSENCVYTREDKPNSRYCFKKGGELYPRCTDNECNSATAMQQQLNLAIDILDDNAKELTTYEENGPDVTTFKGILKGIFSLKMQMLTPTQQTALIKSKTCSGERNECDQCYRTLFDPLVTCMVDKNAELCQKNLNLTSATCKSCFCELSKAKTCNNSLLCPKDKHKDTKNNTDDTHPCDRTCTNSPHFKCVFNLTMEELEATEGEGYKADGRKRPVFTYNKKMPGPTLVICEGDDLVVNLTNRLDKSVTTLHFHGIREITTPWADGVPWVTQCPILPGQSFKYGFNAVNYDDAPPGEYTQKGTYWYHSHVGDQRTNGAYGALIIRPIKTDDRFDEDKAKNTIIVQEWYESPANKTIKSLLINGHGRINSQSMSKYMEYKVDIYDKKYLFRVIGAISEDVPLRLSIDEHTFTAIAVDSQDIEPVTDLTYLWIAGGERYDIVVHTKTQAEAGTGIAHKIRVFGYENPNNENDGPYCTIAWLIYPNQVPDYNVDIICDDDEFNPKPNKRTLNPIPSNFDKWGARLKYPEWKDDPTKPKPGDIFINELRAVEFKPSLHFFGATVVKTLPILEYTELDGLTFNNFRMKNPQVPFLLQDYLPEEDHCGVVCNIHTNPTHNLSVALAKPYITTESVSKVPEGCNDPNKPCTCHHVHQLPYVPGYWTDIMLINNRKDATAHPIHQHGGWFWVLGMGKYKHSINREFIMNEDTKCNTYKVNKTLCLPRNFNRPVAKDTIQVPPGGYVILRTPLGNRGNWFFHCHINKHVLHGMAMVLQIGRTAVVPKYLGQDWCTGPLTKNEACPTPPPDTVSRKIQCATSEVSIAWNYGMKPVEMCVAPGTEVTFHLTSGLNVNKVNKSDYENCIAYEETPATDVFVWTAPCSDDGTYFFISRRNNCLAGMKGKIHVKTNCEQS